MKRFAPLAGLLWVLLLGLHCQKEGTEPAPQPPAFSLILRITPQSTHLWLWDTLGTPLTQAEVWVANVEIPYVPDSGCYFRARGFFSGPVLVEIRGLQETPWLYEVSPPPFRSMTILTPSSGDVYPRQADLYVYWLLDEEATRGTHQLWARYASDTAWLYRSDSLPASQTFWAVPGSLLTREGSLEIQVFSGLYRHLDALANPPAHPHVPQALDFGGSYVAFVLTDTVTVSIGYPGSGVAVWRGTLQGRGTGTWNRVDSLVQALVMWSDTSEFFQAVIPWPPSGALLLGSGGDTLSLTADTVGVDSVAGWFRLWGTRSDSGRWAGYRVP